MIKARLCAICIAAFLFHGNCSPAPVPQHAEQSSSTPEDVVKKYCQMDFDCGWFNPKIDIEHQLTREPMSGGDRVVIVSSFQVISLKQEADSATVKVQYHVLGEIGGGEEFYRGAKSISVAIQLARVGDQWKIAEPIIGVATPHVSLSCAKQFMRRLLDEEVDPARRKKLANVLRQLEHLAE
ncbi:MAG TPA: hypothetical protein VJ085_05915 [Candidatus Acidoferrales bacterium]|nr:hypothetical protein [Candidatus Acidoferrales bacterium]